MADIFTVTKRSEIMRGIRGRGNLSTEVRLILLMREYKITGWRRGSLLPGRPDFLFHRHRIAVFVDGDFWHGNPATFKCPASNAKFWIRKVEYNRKHDAEVNTRLRTLGWRVVRFWESTLRRNPSDVARKLRRLLKLHA